MRQLWEVHREPTRRYLRTLVGPEEVDDLLQEVLLRALRDQPAASGSERSIRDSLRQIARAEARKHRRASRRTRPQAPERLLELREARGQPEGSPPGWAQLADFLPLVGFLPSEQQQVLVLHYLLDLPIGRIAEMLDRTPAATSMLKRRALRSLGRRYQQPGLLALRRRRMPTLVRVRPAPVLAARRFALSGAGAAPGARTAL